MLRSILQRTSLLVLIMAYIITVVLSLSAICWVVWEWVK